MTLRNKTATGIFLVAGIFVILGLVSVTFGASPHLPPRPPGGRLFRFRLPFEAANIDWNQGDVPILVIQNSMRGLYRVDEKGKVVPDLLEEAHVSDDQKTWTFKLKTGIEWSDGKPLKADQFTSSFRRLLDRKTGSSYSYFLFDIKGARDFHAGKSVEPAIRTIDDHSFEVELEQPTPALPAILTHWVTYPIRPDLMAKYPDHWRNPDHMAFLGPFKISEVRQELRVVMIANSHAEKKPWLYRVEGWMIPEDNTAVNLYKTGQLEFMTDPGLEAAGDADLSFRESPIFYFIGIGPGHPLTRSRAGILALSAALDRSEIPKFLNAPHRPTMGFCPPEIGGVEGGLDANDSSKPEFPIQGSPELAKTFLKEAGFTSGTQVPRITLHFFNRPAMRELAEWLQAEWKKNLGIAVSLDGRDPKSYWSELERNPTALFLNSKGTSYPDPDTFFRLFETASPQNLGRWKDPHYDELIKKALREPNAKTRRQLYSEASQVVVHEKPALIPLYYRASSYLIKPFVKGLEINPLTTVDLSEVRYEETPISAAQNPSP